MTVLFPTSTATASYSVAIEASFGWGRSHTTRLP